MKVPPKHYIEARPCENKNSTCMLWLLIGQLRIKIPKENFDFIVEVLRYSRTCYYKIEDKYNDGILRSLHRCEKIEKLMMPNNIKIISYNAYVNHHFLTKIVFSTNLKIIHGGAFKGCMSLQEIVLPNNLHQIGSYAFDKCVSLYKIKMSLGIRSIGEGAFTDCPLLKELNFNTSYDVSISKNAFDPGVIVNLIKGDYTRKIKFFGYNVVY